MDFFARYKLLCNGKGIEPCSQKAAELIGVARAAISSWGTKGMIPKSDTLKTIADTFEVSVDYLLGRTDDPIDWSKVNTYDRDNTCPRILQSFLKLDATDRIKVEAIMEGLLMSDKYRTQG